MKFLKDLIFEDDPKQSENPSQEVAKERVEPTPTPTPIPPTQPQSFLPQSPALAELPDVEQLEKLRRKVYPEQGALVQLQAGIKAVENFIPDEASRFRAAYQMISSTGFSVADIRRQLGDVFDALKHQSDAFEQKWAERQAEEIITRQDSLVSTQKNIAELQQQIVELRQKEESLRQEIAAETVKLEASYRRFSVIVTTVQNEATAIKTKVDTYLEGM